MPLCMPLAMMTLWTHISGIICLACWIEMSFFQLVVVYTCIYCTQPPTSCIIYYIQYLFLGIICIYLQFTETLDLHIDIVCCCHCHYLFYLSLLSVVVLACLLLSSWTFFLETVCKYIKSNLKSHVFCMCTYTSPIKLIQIHIQSILRLKLVRTELSSTCLHPNDFPLQLSSSFWS